MLTGTVVAAVVAASTGCGLGAGKSPSGNELLITTNYGARAIVQTDKPKTGGSDTVMRLLERNAKDVKKRFGGGFVQTIDGQSGGTRDGRPVDWFFYVNGVQADKGAASIRLREGDRVWWDLHDWGASGETSTVVGQFPEPFVHGINGRRMPTRVECVELRSDDCTTVRDKLVELDVPAAKGIIARSFVRETLRVLVGPWKELRGDATAQLLERGPSASGVFAKPAADGQSIQLLDDQGRATRRLGRGVGLIAATAIDGERPVWLVTGTDAAGVRGAVQAFDEGALAGRFAIAIVDGKPLPVPDVGTR